MVLFTVFFIGGMTILLSLMLILIIIGRPKSAYEQRIDDEEQIAFIEEYKKRKEKAV